MKLYHRAGAGRPIRVRWALGEAGIDHEVHVMDADECGGSEHAGRQPLNRVPVLDDGKGPIFESAAILLHIGDLAGDKLTFEPGSHERALVYQWVLFNMTEIEPPFVEPLLTQDLTDATKQAKADASDKAHGVIEQALDGGKHLVGGRFTLADLVVSDTLILQKLFVQKEFSPALEAYIAEHQARPARQKAEELFQAQPSS